MLVATEAAFASAIWLWCGSRSRDGDDGGRGVSKKRPGLPPKLMTYATALRAGIAVWAVAAMEPPFLREHLDALSEHSEAFEGSRQFAAVTVTLESDPSPVPLPIDVPLIPRMRAAPRLAEPGV
jgi:hypothetical protein